MGTADPGAVIHFTLDGSAIAATATANASGAWSYMPTSLGDGQHTVMASETNAAGATGAAFLTFTLDAQAPAPILTGVAPANGQATLAGTTGEAGTQVHVYDGNNWLGMATTGSDGTWHFAASTASSAVHSFGVLSVDPAGHVRSGLDKLILGSTGADTLAGGPGSEVIVGNGGNDTITGAAGADTLTGGSGKVTFAYNGTADSTPAAADTITDFRPGSDKIDLTSIAAISAANGTPLFQGNISGSGNLTLNAHSVAYLEVGATTQVLVNTSNAAETVSTSDMHAADMKIGLLGVHLGLAATDFHHA
jgi:Ca2+-binding RTX toxin-like protein